MRNIYIAILILTILQACSKSKEDKLIEEEGKIEETVIDNTKNNGSVKLDSLVIGSWQYLGSSMDVPPHYAPAQPGDNGVLTFRANAAYVEMRKGRIIDSGKYRVLDTAYFGGNKIRMLYLESIIRIGYKNYWSLSLRSDSLSYGGGFGGPHYRRIVIL